ncbi:unnamed protein product [Ceratitis capitata]|uniref:(Mediterranean fruit fly) hypothetical protein n=1 Tax=Ceratitis capitata TaxID=7213 RepID=A0A811V4G1_CERCA|nr:unnamed protein product [Ceratitis capitata]
MNTPTKATISHHFTSEKDLRNREAVGRVHESIVVLNRLTTCKIAGTIRSGIDTTTTISNRRSTSSRTSLASVALRRWPHCRHASTATTESGNAMQGLTVVQRSAGMPLQRQRNSALSSLGAAVGA